MSFTINSHEKTNRVQVVNIKGEDLDRLIFPFQKHTLTSLEYKPFSRFTLAKSLDEVFENKLGKALVKILKDRKTGTIIIEPEINNKKFDKDFLVKLSTGFAYLVGNPNFDSMTDKYYARFYVKHQDASDSYLRKAYTNLDLHTDGTYVKEKTDWLIMTKMEEQGVSGGESVILHLDDWEHLEELSKNPVGQQNFVWGSPKSKNKIELPLPVGSTIFSNNYFWLHGRKPFKENTNLSRELLRIRGTFFN